MLASARDHYRLQQRITAQGVVDAQKATKKGPRAVAAVVAAYQIAAARAGAQAVPAMLAEQAVTDPPVGAVAATALAGFTSAGNPLQAYFEAIENVAQIGLAVATQIQDAGRNGSAVAIAARAQVGYARMLNLPSCRDCIVLAGAWYKWNAGFERHPKCDCRHIPALEADASGVTTNPNAAFDSLTRDQQDEIFGEADAEAIRLGADIGQVVRSRRGMRKAQLFGREAWITLEGTTKRGLYGSSEGARVAGYTETRVGQRGYVKNQVERRTKRARLMPETIMAIAGDREEAQRLLTLYGYILP